MKRIFRKNQIVVAALALLIAGAGYLNYTYENDEKDIATMAAKDSKEEKAKDTEATAIPERGGDPDRYGGEQ